MLLYFFSHEWQENVLISKEETDLHGGDVSAKRNRNYSGELTVGLLETADKRTRRL